MQTYIPPTLSRFEHDPLDEPEDFDFDPQHQPKDLSITNIVTYIAGYVVRKMISVIHCDICRISLVSQRATSRDLESHQFINLRNNGGLVTPADGVIVVLMCAEKMLRLLTCGGRKAKHNTLAQLFIKVMGNICH